MPRSKVRVRALPPQGDLARSRAPEVQGARIEGTWAVLPAISQTGTWRQERPVVDGDVCNLCNICVIYCPTGVMGAEAGRLTIDYEFCKGCGLCVKACAKGAITMVPELAGEGARADG